MKTRNTRGVLLLLAAGSAAALAGCGGGGGNGNSGIGTTGTTSGIGTATGTNTGVINTSQVVGKVTDVGGKGVPGVSIAVDSGGQITTTLGTGGYRLDGLSGSIVHKISAAATVGNVQYTGSTQVSTVTNSLVSNANIILSATNQQTTVQGFVRDSSGKAVVGASVYVAVPSAQGSGTTGSYSSLTAFTDSTGFYQASNVPASLPGGSLQVAAGGAGLSNQSVTLPQSAVSAGGVLTQNFTLAVTNNIAADVPVIVGVNAFTQPADGLTGAALGARLSSNSGSAYEGIRRLLSPGYAAQSARRQGLGKRLASRATLGGYAVEIDLGFNPPAATNINLIGYNVYRTTGTLAASPVTELPALFRDAVADPLASYYTDVTASTDSAASQPYLGGTTYNFALSAIGSTVTGGQVGGSESAISNAITITPLGPLTLSVPGSGTTVANPVTFAWNSVSGATKYYIFLYNQYPSVGSTPLPGSGPAPVGSTTASISLTSGATYYAIVVGAADQTPSLSAPGVSVQSYSKIVPFTVQ